MTFRTKLFCSLKINDNHGQKTSCALLIIKQYKKQLKKYLKVCKERLHCDRKQKYISKLELQVALNQLLADQEPDKYKIVKNVWNP